ncbi:DUF433 domain-containing protein [Anabaena sp. FACHB-1250]|uniref:DUF433 domain-containing protein n=1 Tax=Dolichospermum planctonicum TaxID=136072 RepID=A0A480AB67_9CYAN|nr:MULTISPECIES: DUF433 domain-containing protein [Nostocales]MBD2143190.1 DUF433 domain-containing protein [Anabaena sp. FACHB-1250]MBD2270573.1 DUF433 domain-containing protein [Anabaena sp. FACHB-1391]GCL40488.1 hypothetical protein NIES80_01750 [Dolichospermum planctonicum]
MQKQLKQIIVSDPEVMMGKPVIAGTRITVELILEKLAAGETAEQILESHPRLTPEVIPAALAFAAEALRYDVIYPIVEKAS